MEEAPENGKESSHSAHANGMNEWEDIGKFIMFIRQYLDTHTNCHIYTLLPPDWW
jgi:hypothetical protein